MPTFTVNLTEEEYGVVNAASLAAKESFNEYVKAYVVRAASQMAARSATRRSPHHAKAMAAVEALIRGEGGTLMESKGFDIVFVDKNGVVRLVDVNVSDEVLPPVCTDGVARTQFEERAVDFMAATPECMDRRFAYDIFSLVVKGDGAVLRRSINVLGKN